MNENPTGALAKALHSGCVMHTTQHGWEAHEAEVRRRILPSLREQGFAISALPATPGQGDGLDAGEPYKSGVRTLLANPSWALSEADAALIEVGRVAVGVVNDWMGDPDHGFVLDPLAGPVDAYRAALATPAPGREP